MIAGSVEDSREKIANAKNERFEKFQYKNDEEVNENL